MRLTRRRAGDRVLLFLLDEILHGTNTSERQIAARHIIGYLLAIGATGVVSTHDLTLADSPEFTKQSTLVHFTEHFERGEDGRPVMTFDYRLQARPSHLYQRAQAHGDRRAAASRGRGRSGSEPQPQPLSQAETGAAICGAQFPKILPRLMPGRLALDVLVVGAGRHVHVHGLDTHSPRSGEAVEDQIARAAEDAGLEPVHHRIHAHASHPYRSSRRARYRSASPGAKHLLEDVAVAMQPDDAFALGRGESVDEESGGAEEHIADALLPREAVIQIAGRRQILMLAHLDGLRPAADEWGRHVRRRRGRRRLRRGRAPR